MEEVWESEGYRAIQSDGDIGGGRYVWRRWSSVWEKKERILIEQTIIEV